MYIVYSNNLKNGDVSSRGSQYKHRNEAIANLVKEAQDYLTIFKRVENYKIVETMDQNCISDDIEWYIERTEDMSVTLYKVKSTSGYIWGKTYEIERVFIFSVMDVPSTESRQEHTYIPETPRIKDIPRSIRDTEMYDELVEVLEARRKALN